jgi:hypothetical protein
LIWSFYMFCRASLYVVFSMATKREPSGRGYNQATLFLGDINAGSWPSVLGESRIWDSKILSWGPRDSDLRTTALARTSSNCKRQSQPLVIEDVT